MQFKKNPKPGICPILRCSNKSLKDRKMCSKHTNQWRKESNPCAYHFNCLKQNAKRRKKDFSITLEQFVEFCNKTGYMDNKGKKRNDLQIDRIRVWEGYHIDNIQVLTAFENKRKMHVEYFRNQETGRREMAIPEPPIDLEGEDWSFPKPDLSGTGIEDLPF